ncbi:MAG: hybrid sensor histidine kinase/response regulator [Candidatus Lokiarchaeia archaeon]
MINKGKVFVLLIEDNLGDARLIKEMLKEAKIGNYNLIIKNSLSEGLEELLKNRVDLILLDLMLPDSSGLRSVTILLDKVRDTPVIVLTGRNDEELALNTLKLGIQDYLVKGNIESTLLERSIIYALERHNIKIELKEKEKMVREALFHTKFYEDIFIHNINNTFQGILSATELCNMQINKLNSSRKIKDILNIIEEQILEGTNLISNVRKLTQIEEEKIKIEPIEVKVILSKSIDNLKNNFHNHNIEVKVISPNTNLFIKANNLLDDVFKNVLNNAVQHNQSSLVEIIIKFSTIYENRDKYLKLEFIDNGIGIENSRRKTLFAREYNNYDFRGGLGLGLSLTSKIIESYNGKIWVEDRIKGDYTKGSNFVILIPEVG